MAMLLIFSAFILIALPLLWFGLGISLIRGKHKKLGWLSFLFAFIQVLTQLPGIPFWGSWLGHFVRGQFAYYLAVNVFLFSAVVLHVYFAKMVETGSEQ